jgi:hypothetical protein
MVKKKPVTIAGSGLMHRGEAALSDDRAGFGSLAAAIGQAARRI